MQSHGASSVEDDLRVVVDAAMGGELYCPGCETSFDNGDTCPRCTTKLLRLVAQTDPLLGRELDGRFTILEKLGAGGMGAVYRASQHSVSREVAIKVVHASLVSDAAVIKRFLREAKLASKLSHPNAVSVMDFGQTEDGLFYLVMELIEGDTLDVHLEEHGVFDARRLVAVGSQVCDALEAAHSLSIIHRDLKPSNIMVLDQSRDFVKVLDFGLAKSLENETASQMTGSGNMIGTPAYMPPERACGESGDVRSDLYSLGCILYLLGSGKLPFDAVAVQDLLLKQVMEPPPPMTGVPFVLAQVIDRLLCKDPNARYQTAAETRAALEAAAELFPPRSGSQPALNVALTDHVTMASPHGLMAVAFPRAPTRRPFKSAAVARLEQSDTMDAPAVTPSALTPAIAINILRARTFAGVLRANPRARWWAAGGVGAVAIALAAFLAVATPESPARADAATLPEATELTRSPTTSVTQGQEAAPLIVSTPPASPSRGVSDSAATPKPPVKAAARPGKVSAKRDPTQLPF